MFWNDLLDISPYYQSTSKVFNAVILNWWVVIQKWVRDLFSLGCGPLPESRNKKAKGAYF